jgi:transcriptional regulator with XRE-family HTH domain
MIFTGGKIWASSPLGATREKTSAMNVGKAIRLCRTQQGASQSAIADRANCSVSYLSMLENNKRDPTLSTVTKIAEALNVPVGVLFVLAADQNELGKSTSTLPIG